MTSSLAERRRAFRACMERREALILPGAGNALTARVIAEDVCEVVGSEAIYRRSAFERRRRDLIEGLQDLPGHPDGPAGSTDALQGVMPATLPQIGVPQLAQHLAHQHGGASQAALRARFPLGADQ